MTSAWNWSAWPLATIAALAGFYALFARLRVEAKSILYVIGLVLILVALVSPLNLLADHYLFTARELQSLILFLIAPALLVLGLPALAAAPGAAPVRLAVAAWLAGMSTLVLWHIPRFFDASLHNQSLQIIEQASLLISGSIFWWPALGPLNSQRLKPVPWASVYLFAACVVCSLIGLSLTYTSAGLHRDYLNPSDPLGILPTIRDQWRFSYETDQETAGLLMWAGGCMVCAVCVMGLFLFWYNSPEVRGESSGDSKKP